jgi:hypothetical protein
LLATEDKEEIRVTGIFFSKMWNIVESDEWANLKPEEGDGGGNSWNTPGADVRKKEMSDRQSGKSHTKEWNENIRAGLIGVKHTTERKKNISEGKRRSPMIITDEYREKMRKAITGKKRSPETRVRMREAALNRKKG